MAYMKNFLRRDFLVIHYAKKKHTIWFVTCVLQSYSEPANKILFTTFFSGDDNGQKPHGSDAVFMHRIVQSSS